MKIPPLDSNAMAKWKAVVDEFQNELFRHKFVHGFGVAYEFDSKKCRFKSGIKLTVVVDQDFFSLNDREKNKIKPTYGAANWPVQVLPLPNRNEQARSGLSLRKVTQPVNPIIGGVEIGNSKLCRGRSGVLGAIVYDRTNGHPLGLSVHHAVDGDEEGCGSDDCPFCTQQQNARTRGNSVSWWDRRAIKDDPISQPNTGGTENQIGRLLNFHQGYDAAVFKLDSKGNREVKPIVNGLNGEVGEPVDPVLGTRCLFRSTRSQTQGFVAAVMRMKYPNESRPAKKNKGKQAANKLSKGAPTIREEIWFQVDEGYPKTYGGDSGGLWVTENGFRPIGLHTGEHWLRNKHRCTEIYLPKATSMVQLVNKFHRFVFSPICYNKLLKQISPFFNAFVDAPESEGFFSFSLKTTGIQPLQVQKYTDAGKTVGRPKTRRNSDVDAINGISATCLNKHIYAFWRSMSTNQIKMGRWDQDGDRVNIFGAAIHTLHSERTAHRPAAVTHKDRIFLAFTDPNGRIGLRISDGVNWNHCWCKRTNNTKNFYFGTRAISAPALASYKNKLLLAWVGERGTTSNPIPQINVMEITPSLSVSNQNRFATKIVASSKLPNRLLPKGDIAIAVSDRLNELFLAFTATGGSLEIYSLPIANWTQKKWAKSNAIYYDATTSNPPTIFSHDGNVICSRELPTED